MEVTGDEDAHGTRAAERVGHAREVPPRVGFERVELDLGIEGAVVEIHVVGNAHELVVVMVILAEAVDTRGKERRFRSVGGDGGEEAMAADGGVPESDVVGDVGDAEKAVTGTEDFDAVTVTHERVCELQGFQCFVAVQGF